MEKVTYEGKQGYLEGNQFYPKEAFEQVTYEGLLLTGSNKFFPVEAPLTDDTKTDRSTGQRVAAAVAPYARPVLETGGLLLGGAVGAGGGTLAAPGAGSVAGGVLGAGLGYAAGRNIATGLEEYAGARKPETLPRNFLNAGKDVVSGAGMEAGGQVQNYLLQKGLQKVVPAVAEATYRRVLKPVPSTPKAESDIAVKLGLKEGYAVTEGGAAKAQKKFKGLLTQVDDIVKGMKQTDTLTVPGETTTKTIPGKTVVSSESKWSEPYREIYHEKGNVGNDPTHYMSKYPKPQLDQWRRMFKGIEVKPDTIITVKSPDTSIERPAIDMREVVKSIEKPLLRRYGNLPEKDLANVQNLLEEYAGKHGGYLTPIEAQDMKKDLYEYITDSSYGEIADTTKETLKGVARGVRQALLDRDNTGLLNKVNKEESEHIIFREIQQRALNRTKNWDVLGLSDLAGAGVGGAVGLVKDRDVGGTEKGVVGGAMIARALRSPALMSNIAIQLSKTANMNPAAFMKLISYYGLRRSENSQ